MSKAVFESRANECHLRAPWRLGYSDPSVVYDSEGRKVAEVSGPSWEEVKVRARRIAALPKLLEVLADALQLAQTRSDHQHIAAIRAALNEAGADHV